ncbi:MULTISPECIES: glycosyl transferase [unclassified Microbacterium]|uniref:glycosyl transferase n=1 Tax=unclassified Microbacterium TaxID=2609290 RepID=UPI0012FB6D6B|nr:glycosyl transferase [Microbacterium sp. MAH-37]MVQ42682.1 glycosyl transferase [Microbacterium sp. MAH-37]
MMAQGQTAGEIGDGYLSRATATIYRWMVLAAFLALFGAPTLLVWMGLGLTGGMTAIFYVAALLPVAPALSAALYAQRAWAEEPDLRPARPLWRGLLLNLRDVLAWWIPVLLIAGVLAVNIVGAGAVAGGAVLRSIAIVLLAVLVLWSTHLLVITSYYSFRTRDAMRIAAAELFTQWRATIGFAALAFVAVAVVAVSSEAVLLLCAWAFALLLRLTARPVEADVRSRFTA